MGKSSMSESQLVDKPTLSHVNRMRMNSTSPVRTSIDRSYKSDAYVQDSQVKSSHLRVNRIDVNFGAALGPVHKSQQSSASLPQIRSPPRSPSIPKQQLASWDAH